VGMQKHHVNT